MNADQNSARARLGVVPSLPELLDHPEQAMDLAPPVAVAALVKVEGLAAVLRLAATPATARNGDRTTDREDRDLTVAEAAARLRKSPRWVREHRRTLPGFHKRGRDTFFREVDFERGRKRC